MGCTSLPNERDDQMLDASARGENCNLDRNTLEALKPELEETRKGIKKIEKNIERIIPPTTASILNNPKVEIRILPETPPQEIKDSDVMEKILSFDPKDPLLIEERNRNFRNTVTENEKYPPKSVPRVEETNTLAKRIIPTGENLIRMLNKGQAPLDEKGNSLEIHHWKQKSERLILMKSEEHRGKGLTKLFHDNPKGLEKEERSFFKSKQRPNYYRWKAEKYLGDYTKFIKQLDIKDGKIVKK